MLINMDILEIVNDSDGLNDHNLNSNFTTTY